MAKKIYEVEFKNEEQKYYFESLQQANDYGAIFAGFGGKQFRIRAIIVQEAVKK